VKPTFSKQVYSVAASHEIAQIVQNSNGPVTRNSDPITGLSEVKLQQLISYLEKVI
jgi:hypothetical protein